MSRTSLRPALGAAALGVVLAACGGGDPPSPAPVSPAERSNREMRARAEPSDSLPHRLSPAFAGAFRLRGRTALRVPDGDYALPGQCAVGEDGVYLAARRTPALLRWSFATGRTTPLPVPRDAAPEDPTALAWEGVARTLLVLDADGRRVRRYDAGGRPLGYAFLNAGQTGFALAAAEGGGVLVGGERWEDDGRATLLATYSPAGRLRRAFLPMDPQVIRDNTHVYAPVSLAAEEGGTVVAAEPTSFTLVRMDARGTVLRRFGEAPPGYLPPVPLPAPLPPDPELEAWMAGWTPLLFVHAGAGLVFSAFQVRRPFGGFQLDVYGPGGSRVAAGLLSDARPACGRGRLLVFQRRTGPGSMELMAYEYVGPGAVPGAGEEVEG